MPQGDEKTGLEKLEFKTMLTHVNLLYLGCAVLVLLDLSYLNRFWVSAGWPCRMRAERACAVCGCC